MKCVDPVKVTAADVALIGPPVRKIYKWATVFKSGKKKICWSSGHIFFFIAYFPYSKVFGKITSYAVLVALINEAIFENFRLLRVQVHHCSKKCLLERDFFNASSCA